MSPMTKSQIVPMPTTPHLFLNKFNLLCFNLLSSFLFTFLSSAVFITPTSLTLATDFISARHVAVSELSMGRLDRAGKDLHLA